jgi:hypothetical protein
MYVRSHEEEGIGGGAENSTLSRTCLSSEEEDTCMESFLL